MTRRFSSHIRFAGAVVLALTASLMTANPSRGADSEAKAAPPKADSGLPLNRLVGQRLANFTLLDAVTERNVSLYGFRGKHAVVLAFLGTDCPVGDLYIPRLVELNKAFKDRGVVFLGINANAHETVAQVAEHAKKNGIDFPVLKDQGNLVADSAFVERTCEVIVLDGLAMIRYRGAIDDQYGFGTRKPAAEHNYLRQAIEDVLTGGRVDVKATPVVGCLLDKVDPKPTLKNAGQGVHVRAAAPAIMEGKKDSDQAEASHVGPVNYAEHVAGIVQNKCQSCHRPGEVAPFSLSSYDDVRKHAAMLREVVEERRMPPWHADPRYGHFKNDRSLSAKERATLLAWVDQGTPLGDPSKVPAAKTFPEGWTIGKPDVIFEMPEPYLVPAQGTVAYVHFRVPTNFKEDVWVQAAEARPSDRAIVHHIVVYVLSLGMIGLDRGFDGRADSHLCGYAPGDMPSVYPEGSAKRIPAGASLLLEIHYTPNGKVKSDRSKVGLIFAKGPVKHQAHTHGIAQPRFQIPPGADSHEVASSFTLKKDVTLLSLMPHMHLRGKDFRYEIEYPDHRKETLLSVPAYDFGWQSYYTLAEPLPLPKGSTIHCLAHFDNSSKNPYNPDPSKSVRWGEQTWEEMMIGYVDYVDDPAPEKPKTDTKAAVQDNSPGAISVVRTLNNVLARQKPASPSGSQSTASAR